MALERLEFGPVRPTPDLDVAVFLARGQARPRPVEGEIVDAVVVKAKRLQFRAGRGVPHSEQALVATGHDFPVAGGELDIVDRTAVRAFDTGLFLPAFDIPNPDGA